MASSPEIQTRSAQYLNWAASHAQETETEKVRVRFWVDYRGETQAKMLEKFMTLNKGQTFSEFASNFLKPKIKSRGREMKSATAR